MAKNHKTTQKINPVGWRILIELISGTLLPPGGGGSRLEVQHIFQFKKKLKKHNCLLNISKLIRFLILRKTEMSQF